MSAAELERGWVAEDLQSEFPELRLWSVRCEAQPGRSTPGLKQRLKAFHGNDKPIGMDFRDPPIDVAGLARAYGVPAHRIETADQFDASLQAALADSSGPVLLDVVVQGGT